MLRRDFLRTLMGAFVAPVIPTFTTPVGLILPKEKLLFGGIEDLFEDEPEGTWADVVDTTITRYTDHMVGEAVARRRHLIKLLSERPVNVSFDLFSQIEGGLVSFPAATPVREVLRSLEQASPRPGSKATGRGVPLLPAPTGSGG